MDVWSQKDGTRSFKEELKADPLIAKYLQNGELEEMFDLTKHLRQVDYIFERVGL
jgi:adenylosuccinate lyase